MGMGSSIGVENFSMTNGMLKVFAGAAICAFTFMILLYCFLLSTANAIEPAENNADVDWNYAVMIDAGSTGSRLFVFVYRSVSDAKLIDIKPVIDQGTLKPVVMKISPGLSSFAVNPDGAAEYIKPLLDHAAVFIPKDKHKITSLFILATAGMRLLSYQIQENILNNLRTYLPKLTSMQIIPEHIKVIEGKWEGIYSWIALNYILDRFNQSQLTDARQPTAGVVDMGGASVQIAMEFNNTDENMGNAMEVVNLGCRADDTTYSYRLYVTTFLGYGVNEGLRKYEEAISHHINSANSTSKSYVRDPCLPINLIKVVDRVDGSQFVRKGYGDWETCVADLAALLTKDVANSECNELKCFLGLVRAPSVSLSTVELYGFSEYWFALEDVLDLGGTYNFTKVAQKSRDYCGMKWSTIQTQFRNKVYPKANDERLRTQCFKSAWMLAVLHSGLSVGKISNRFQSVFHVNGQEAHWALGAVLYYMRFFPLREVTKRFAIEKSHDGSSLQTSTFYYIFLPIMIAILFVLALCRIRKRRYIRREKSMWGYMMLSQDQL